MEEKTSPWTLDISIFFYVCESFGVNESSLPVSVQFFFRGMVVVGSVRFFFSGGGGGRAIQTCNSP